MEKCSQEPDIWLNQNTTFYREMFENYSYLKPLDHWQQTLLEYSLDVHLKNDQNFDSTQMVHE
jgi:hypothetical protein